ncbi:MAG: hypothetical protein EP344_16335 [Bacteroidetes bacterium]|nr:MAG: hypothetical protein EP344_16335 [Bacteroidota bacterium]
MNLHTLFVQATRSWLATILLLAVCLSMFFVSCSPSYLYEEQKDVPGGAWSYTDTLDFRFTVTDTLETFNVYLDFEYADTFRTQNIYLKLYTLFPDGKRLSKQKSVDFFDAQGKPLGECSGHTCRLQMVLQEKAYFNTPGEYCITLEQFTRENPLPGIFAVGLAVEPTGIKR